MAELIYTEGPEVFARDLLRPPHLARMIEEAGRYTRWMEPEARSAVLESALEQFWYLRGSIRECGDVQSNWRQALRLAMMQRSRWRMWFRWDEFEWVSSKTWRGER